MRRGAYALFLRFDRAVEIKVGALGSFTFEGEYCYIGSALNGLDQRLTRHFSKEKKIHWHIDHLTMVADSMEAYLTESVKECDIRRLAEQCEMIPAVNGFGCSDCNCRTHLLRPEKGSKEKLVRSVGLIPFEI